MQPRALRDLSRGELPLGGTGAIMNGLAAGSSIGDGGAYGLEGCVD